MHASDTGNFVSKNITTCYVKNIFPHVKKYFIYLQIAFFCEDRKVLDLIGVFLSGSDIID